MGDAKTCSKLLSAVLELRVQCGHCGVTNYIRDSVDPNDTDASKMDIEGIVCWECSQESLLDDSLLDIYPSGVEEAVNIVGGKPVGAFN
jgi:hypothetical protein